MISRFIILLLIIFLCSFQMDSFKDNQLRYQRVRQAYQDMEENMLILLQYKQVNKDRLKIYLRAFKSEKKIELWGKNDSDNKYKFIKTYSVCWTSGSLGPKRKHLDFQIPEGFYHINRFNPDSKYHLSLGINYPNKSDRILGMKDNLGGDIYIHGACVTMGCLPITDEQIKELYIFCIEARNNGQIKIPITIFPSKLSETEFNRLTEKYRSDSDRVELWTDLKKAFDVFNETNELPVIEFLNTGRHNVKV